MKNFQELSNNKITTTISHQNILKTTQKYNQKYTITQLNYMKEK